MELPIFQVDAFTDKPFKGNPAAVVILDSWLPDMVMQSIAQENNLSETAFICPGKNFCQIRWFTPICEVELCGHATLAAAHVIFEYLNPPSNKLTFSTQKAGNLHITKSNDNWLEMDFPSYLILMIDMSSALSKSLGHKPAKTFQAGPDILAIYLSEKDIHNIKPDFQELSQINTRGVIITAKANENSKEIDFVSRFFAPRIGVLEDPVTGSAHCALVPYWSDQLNKETVVGHQISSRGGILKCKHRQNRVMISGQAICVIKGNLVFDL